MRDQYPNWFRIHEISKKREFQIIKKRKIIHVCMYVWSTDFKFYRGIYYMGSDFSIFTWLKMAIRLFISIMQQWRVMDGDTKEKRVYYIL